MSLKMSKWAWDQTQAHMNEKLVLLALADFAKDCGCCYPSTRTLASMINISVRTVQHHIKYLIDQGLVVRTKRGKGKRKSGFKLVGKPGEMEPCSETGCVEKTKSPASSIKNHKEEPIEKEITIKEKEIREVPEWLKILDLTTDIKLSENLSHPSVKDDIIRYIDSIEKDFGHDLDLESEAKKYQLWWEGKRVKKPKLAFRNWLEKASKINGEHKKGIGKGRSTPVSKTIDEATRQFAEQQRKQRESIDWDKLNKKFFRKT